MERTEKVVENHEAEETKEAEGLLDAFGHPVGSCEECGSILIDHRDQCPQGIACKIGPGELFWCPGCEDLTLG